MKAVWMIVMYGKNQRFEASNWVMENAIEEYKKYREEMMRGWGWKKEITFKVYKDNYCEVVGENDKPMGEIFGFTKNGFETIKTK